ncbi:MAG: hypothetical protein QOH25_1000 [Acidobacteriota bacterium]|jgi:hypothetical protein|nr:hypothetical protein [Acidobacteriota bacterium]
MADRPRLGSESFWEMAALAMEGWLASCQSCVEHYYYQSWANATAFLESCAEGGLVVRVSLLDLKGDVGPRISPTLWQQRYDQAIYISAPVFRKENLDAARRKIEGTKNAVYNAFHLYYEVLGADDKGINNAYMHAVQKGKLLRWPDIARERQDVALSSVAELRLIQDGFKNSMKGEKQITEATTGYVLRFSRQEAERPQVSDHIEELEEFVIDFLADKRDLAEFSQEGFKPPLDYRLRLLPVIKELTYYLYRTLSERDIGKAQSFVASVREQVDEAKMRAASDETYNIALAELREDLDGFVSSRQAPILVPTSGPNHASPGALVG